MVAPLALLGAASIAADLLGSLTNAGKPTPAASGADPAKIRKTANEFESVFLEQTFDRLTEGAGEDGPLGNGGAGGSVYRSMLMKEHAGQITKTGGIGIADAVFKQMLRLQEGSGSGV